MSRRERPILVASVADVDESGNIIEGTDRYASSVAPSSPAKEQPNTGRARREKARRDSSSPITTSALTDSDSTVHPRALKKPSRDREKSVSNKKALMAASRPPVKHAKTTQSIPRRDESSFYGVEPTITSATTRPRAATRPASYYAPSRPPPANARYWANQPPGASLPTSFPPPAWGPPPMPGPGSVPPPFGSPSPAPLIMQHQPPPPRSDYYSRPLESRFGGSVRPQSAMGYRPPRALEYEEYEEYEKPIEKSLMRRPSTTRKVSKNDEDRKAMPPPPRRPASARPGALAFRPPPQTPARRRVDLDEHDPDVDEGLFRDLSPLAGSYEYTSPLAFRPRPSFGADSSYDPPDYQTEVAGKHQRRNSYYAGGNSASSGSAYEDKIRQATRYQDDAARYTDDTGSGPNLPLTAEALRNAGRSGASSRSTRSSGSHDESDYRQSATTRTTRSTAPNDEDVTIRVKGSTVLKFGNTEMQCQDGAEINITSRSGQPEIRNPGGGGGSDRSSYVDPQQDDRRTRVDIPTSRARAQSRAKSRPRSFSRPSGYAPPPKYEIDRPRYEVGRYDAGGIHPAPEYDNYSAYGSSPFGPPPSYPDYPQYPSSYSSRHGDGYFGGPPPM